MKKTILIGNHEFKYKKDAIAYYRGILNSYNFGQSLNDSDFDDLMDLLEYAYEKYDFNKSSNSQTIEFENENLDDDLHIVDIKVSRVHYGTKCFELFYSDNSSEYISYLMIINNTTYTPERLFSVACRNSVQDDMMRLKQKYFDENSVKGEVKCQETGKLSKWTELVIDHRQPKTFSVIVDRFVELHKLDLNQLEYITNDKNQIVFQDGNISIIFRDYHNEKANLRIVRKECNLSRSGLARLKRSTKDLKISTNS